jgi:nucleolin
MLSNYQKFMKKRLAELKDEEPNMEQSQRMKRAAQDWHKQSGGNVLADLLNGMTGGKRRRRSSKKSQKRKSSKRKQRR